MSKPNGESRRDAYLNKDGGFKRGNPGGPSGPKKGNKYAQLSRKFEEAVDGDVLAAILKRMARLALEGSVRAANFVFDRRLGKAPQVLQVAGDTDLLELVQVMRATQQRLMAIPEVRKVLAKEVLERQTGCFPISGPTNTESMSFPNE